MRSMRFQTETILHIPNRIRKFPESRRILGEDPANCVVVEDAYAGIDAAKAAGMLAVGLGDAFGYEKTDVKIEYFAQLLDVE